MVGRVLKEQKWWWKKTAALQNRYKHDIGLFFFVAASKFQRVQKEENRSSRICRYTARP
jgi:hypothetical protein